MERYTFLQWGQKAFNNFRVVPPGTGICHQVNLEYLAQTVWTETDQTARPSPIPDTLVGTDSHTTMVNGLAVLGWGVGGIEAEAAMLGQPISMLIPEVVGFKLTGELKEGVDRHRPGADGHRRCCARTASSASSSSSTARASTTCRSPTARPSPTWRPEYGATCGFFPIDDETLRYLRQTGREEDRIALVEAYAKENGFWRDAGLCAGLFLDPVAGPEHRRPGDLGPQASAGSRAADRGVHGLRRLHQGPAPRGLRPRGPEGQDDRRGRIARSGTAGHPRRQPRPPEQRPGRGRGLHAA